jgi:anti-repressor protein
MVNAIEMVNSSNIATMTSIEIARLTEKEHKNVLADIDKMFVELEIYAAKFSATRKDARWNIQRYFTLDKELTLTLVSGYNVRLRQAIIRRWQELESPKPRTYAEIMQEAILLANAKVLELEEQILEDRPKVSFATAVAWSATSVNIGDWVKSIQPNLSRPIGRTKAFAWMRESGFLMRNNRPYQHFIDQKIFEVKQGIVLTPKGDIPTFTTLITGKGQLYLLEKISHIDEPVVGEKHLV